MGDKRTNKQSVPIAGINSLPQFISGRTLAAVDDSISANNNHHRGSGILLLPITFFFAFANPCEMEGGQAFHDGR